MLIKGWFTLQYLDSNFQDAIINFRQLLQKNLFWSCLHNIDCEVSRRDLSDLLNSSWRSWDELSLSIWRPFSHQYASYWKCATTLLEPTCAQIPFILMSWCNHNFYNLFSNLTSVSLMVWTQIWFSVIHANTTLLYCIRKEKCNSKYSLGDTYKVSGL